MDKFAGQLHSQPSGAGRHARPLGGLGAFSPARRLTALLLAGALMLGLGLTAGAEQLQPTQVAPDDFPYITVETNLVMNEASKLPQVIEVEEDGAAKEYGFIEVALRVGPGSGTEEQMLQVFAALAYDSAVLTPVTWNAENPDTGKRDLYQVMNIAGATPATPLVSPALKADVMDTGAARILGADEDGYVAFSLLAGVDSVPTTLKGTADAPTTLHGDSRLVAVRFRYDAAAHPFSYDAENKVILDGDATLTRPLITWANDANAAGSDGGMSLAYVGGTPDKQMYFVAAAPDPTDTTKWTVVDGLNKPTTSSVSIIKAVDAAGTGYSYESNFFPVEDAHLTALGLTTGDPRIRFTQVMGVTADQGSGGISLDDLSTILFYDWDDTLLGALTVPKGVDVRETVNDYVRDNFIHPELRYDKDDPTKNVVTRIDNTARTNSYRGTFPHDNPGGAEFSGTGIKEDADGDGVVDANAGSRFPLTNKLDYVFMKKKMIWNEDYVSWDEDPSFEGGVSYDKEFPYIYGWMHTTVETLEDTWTTINVGELQGYDVDGGIHYIDMSTHEADIGCYNVQDFTNLSDTMVAVKAIYEPGDDLLKDFPYMVGDAVYYSRYTTETSSANGTYSVQYQYRRVSSNHFGVSRIRQPSLQLLYTPDLAETNADLVEKYQSLYDDNLKFDIDDGFISPDYYGNDLSEFRELFGLTDLQGQPFYMRGVLENQEVIAAEMTPSSAVLEVGYYLIDEYNSSFIQGGVRSAGGELGIVRNFDYENADYATRQGTDGFVFRGTLGMLLEQASKAELGEQEMYTTMTSVATFSDLGLKFSRTAAVTTVRLTSVRNAIRKVVKEALNDPSKQYLDGRGYAKLTWHQVQYAIIHSSEASVLVPHATALAENYDWYRGA